MALGPGKYDKVCTDARESAKAEGVLLLIFNGELGSGFSIQASAKITAALPAILRKLADDIEPNVIELWREH